MSATISIKNLYELRLDEYSALVGAEQQNLHSLRQQASTLEGEIKGLSSSVGKMQELQVQACEAKLDTRPLEKEMLGLANEIKQKESDLKKLQDAQENLKPKSRAMKSVIEALKALQELGVTDAIEVERSEECFEGIKVRLGDQGSPELQEGGFARVSSCLAECDLGRPISIPIEGSSPAFDPTKRPEMLWWVPANSTESYPPPQQRASHQIAPVWIEKSTGRIIVCFDESFHRAFKNDGRDEEAVRTFAEGVAQLRTLALAELEAAGGKLNLSHVYTEGSFLARVKAQVQELTVTKPRFTNTSANRDPRNVAKELQSDWQTFIQAPWSASISGDAAILKYTLESGERARFWHETYDNHYGFRVRTRDHTWIEGQIFIDRDAPAATESTLALVSRPSYEKSSIVTHGRMYLLVFQRR
ncbi:MAG: hypothetical protein U0570_10800 [Phycisphaerales bacterium]